MLLCLTGAGIAHGAARSSGSASNAAAPVGALVCLIALVAADRRRWGRMETGYSWTDDPEDIARAGALLQRRGVPVRVEFRAASSHSGGRGRAVGCPLDMSGILAR